MYNKRIVPAEVFCRVLERIVNDPKFTDQEIRNFIRNRLKLVVYKDHEDSFDSNKETPEKSETITTPSGIKINYHPNKGQRVITPNDDVRINMDGGDLKDD